jgi:hypothetical protein
MKTIQTKPDCTLGFVEEALVKTNGDLLAYLWERVNFLHSYKLLGKLSEITEEQARELMEVDKGHIGFGRICNYLYGLKESAKAVGIEEKDFGSYLVVKL